MTERQTIERRTNTRLREVFDEAVARIRPFLEPGAGWGGHSLEHLAYRTLRERYPDLDRQEIHALLVGAVRVYREKCPAGAPHLSGLPVDRPPSD